MPSAAVNNMMLPSGVRKLQCLSRRRLPERIQDDPAIFEIYRSKP